MEWIDGLLKLGILALMCFGSMLMGYVVGIMQPDLHAWEDYEEEEIYEDPTINAGNGR